MAGTGRAGSAADLLTHGRGRPRKVEHDSRILATGLSLEPPLRWEVSMTWTPAASRRIRTDAAPGAGVGISSGASSPASSECAGANGPRWIPSGSCRAEEGSGRSAPAPPP